MTEQEAIDKLNALTSDDPEGPEGAHAEADAILVQMLIENGFPEVAAAWRNAYDRVGFCFWCT